MKLLLILFFSVNSFANFENAPTEWLISSTVKINTSDHHNKKYNNLTKYIFSQAHYDIENDQLVLKKNSENLRSTLLDFLNSKKKKHNLDQNYLKWQSELENKYLDVDLFRINYKIKGHYFFNHVHTNISQDNAELKFLKLTPKRTFKLIERFLKRRKAYGVVSFTDHDTDKTFDMVSHIDSKRLRALRGIEWGGKTHMCLIDPKKDWPEISNGRKYSGVESINKSRSSEAFRIVNHPNRKRVFPYTSWGDAQGVEVWNTIIENSPFLIFNIKRSNNHDAFSQWKNALKNSKKYTAVAGSDFHFSIPCLKERTLIYPVNFIPETDRSKTKNYLISGRSSFLTRPTAPKLSLISGRFHMGDNIKTQNEISFNLFGDFSDSSRPIGGLCYNVVNNFYKTLSFWKSQIWEIRFYNMSNELVAKKRINPKWYNRNRHFKATLKYFPKKKDLIRAELWSINKKSKSVDLLGATNPIYINW